jgi:tetratricopeptide (TPR) repeat protein
MRIVDAATSQFVWAGRHEFRPEELASIQPRITRRISRELHVLLLQAASRRAFFDAGMEHGVSESLSRAASALQQGMRAELSAEAQRWYLTALASDPRNVEALTGLAITCQHLVSNPWWAEPRVVATASDLGREAAAIALSIAPGHTAAHCVQGMLYSAAGQLDEAGGAFDRALATDSGQGTAHGFAGYNAAFLGRADETVPANERAMSLDRSDRRHSIWLFFGGFAELLLGRTETSISLLRKSLERNPSYGSAQLFLAAALSTAGRDREASEAAAKFRGLSRSIGRVRSNSSGCRVPGPHHTAPRSTRPLRKSVDSAFSIDIAAARRLSGGGLRELARQLERHLLVLLERWQGLLRKLLQLGVVTRALFLLEEFHRLVVVFDHIVRVLVVKGLSVQRLKFLTHPLVL